MSCACLDTGSEKAVHVTWGTISVAENALIEEKHANFTRAELKRLQIERQLLKQKVSTLPPD